MKNSNPPKLFKVGNKVKKITGDYYFEGMIICKFAKRNGKDVRVVVENLDGFLHIFNENQLELTD